MLVKRAVRLAETSRPNKEEYRIEEFMDRATRLSNDDGEVEGETRPVLCVTLVGLFP